MRNPIRRASAPLAKPALKASLPPKIVEPAPKPKPALDPYQEIVLTELRQRTGRFLGLLFSVPDDFGFTPGRGSFSQVAIRYIAIWLMHEGARRGVEELAASLKVNRSTIADALTAIEQVCGRERNLDHVSVESIEIGPDEEIADDGFARLLDLYQKIEELRGYIWQGSEDLTTGVKGWRGSPIMRALMRASSVLWRKDHEDTRERHLPETDATLGPVHAAIRTLMSDSNIRKILGPMVASPGGPPVDALTWAEPVAPLRGSKPGVRIVTGRGKQALDTAVIAIKKVLRTSGFAAASFGVLTYAKRKDHFTTTLYLNPLSA